MAVLISTIKKSTHDDSIPHFSSVLLSKRYLPPQGVVPVMLASVERRDLSCLVWPVPVTSVVNVVASLSSTACALG